MWSIWRTSTSPRVVTSFRPCSGTPSGNTLVLAGKAAQTAMKSASTDTFTACMVVFPLSCHPENCSSSLQGFRKAAIYNWRYPANDTHDDKGMNPNSGKRATLPKPGKGRIADYSPGTTCFASCDADRSCRSGACVFRGCFVIARQEGRVRNPVLRGFAPPLKPYSVAVFVIFRLQRC